MAGKIWHVQLSCAWLSLSLCTDVPPPSEGGGTSVHRLDCTREQSNSPYLSSIVQQCKLLFPPYANSHQIVQTYGRLLRSRHFVNMVMHVILLPSIQLASRFPQKPRPSGIVTFWVTTTLSQWVVYFANETKDGDTPPFENRRFLELYLSPPVYHYRSSQTRGQFSAGYSLSLSVRGGSARKGYLPHER